MSTKGTALDLGINDLILVIYESEGDRELYAPRLPRNLHEQGHLLGEVVLALCDNDRENVRTVLEGLLCRLEGLNLDFRSIH